MTWQRLVKLILLIVITVLLGVCLFGCATPAMKASWMQIKQDIMAEEYDDAEAVADAAIVKWGAPGTFIDSTTTQRTITQIQSEWTLGDYIGGGLGMLGKYVGIDTGILMSLLAALGVYAKRKVNSYKKSAENSSKGIAAIEEKYPEAAVLAKDTVRKAECKGTVLDKIVHKGG